jgi:hypothetical protein
MNNKDNTAYSNTGNRNTGYCNTGNCNTGDYNTGNCNTGNYNTGNCNTGNYNTGNRNTGDYNTGDRNTGNYNTGDLNTNNPTVRLFNKDSGIKFHSEEYRKIRSTISKYQKLLCTWVYTKDMSDKEKENNPTYKTTGGYLKVNKTKYNGKPVTKEDREFLESLPNFCPKILEECTGIVFDKKRTIKLDDKEIEISEESYEAFKAQFRD